MLVFAQSRVIRMQYAPIAIWKNRPSFTLIFAPFVPLMQGLAEQRALLEHELQREVQRLKDELLQDKEVCYCFFLPTVQAPSSLAVGTCDLFFLTGHVRDLQC